MADIFSFIGGVHNSSPCPDDEPFDGHLNSVDPELQSLLDTADASDAKVDIDNLIASTAVAIATLEDYRIFSTDEADEMFAALIDPLPACYRAEVYA